MDLLDRVTIAKPCSASWDAMEGDDRKRFCTHCRLHVYNVAGMERSEAEALLKTGDKVCLRLYRRSDGTVITKDCPVGVRTAVGRTSAIGLLSVTACLWSFNLIQREVQRTQGSDPIYADKLASYVDSLSSWVDAQTQRNAQAKLNNVMSSTTMGSN